MMEKNGNIFSKFLDQKIIKNKNMAKLLEIVKHPNEILRKVSREISLEEIKKPEFIELMKDMEKTMIEKDGAGLAAPQIGENIRLIVLNHEGKNIIMINPQITKKSWAKKTELEGCLSVVDDKGEIYYEKVARHKKVSCLYFDQEGNKKKIEAENLLSRAIQHEIDHLDGILFIDKIEGKSN